MSYGNLWVTIWPVKTFQATTAIHATPQAIWDLLVDGARYPEWNSTVERLEGTIAPGHKIKVHVKVNPGRAFPVKVSDFEPGRRMVWRGGMPFGLFRGERTFSLTPRPDGAVEFSMREVYSGPLSPLIERSIPDLQPAFDEFAASLKRRAERRI